MLFRSTGRGGWPAIALSVMRSTNQGQSWSVCTVPAPAPAAPLMVAVAPDNANFIAVSDGVNLWTSADGGATWSANRLIYRAPAGETICECCHPSLAFGPGGELIALWRNALGGARDMWSSVRSAGATDFGVPAKLGTGAWMLRACPMDGGAVAPLANGFIKIGRAHV